MENRIGLLPHIESLGDGCNEVFKGGKIFVMGTETPRQFPDTLDRIEVRAIRRKKIKMKTVAVPKEPGLEQRGMMPSSIVGNHHHFPSWPGMTKEQLKEDLERLGVEGLFLESHQTSISWTDSSENSHGFSGWGMKEHGINRLRRNPHPATGTVLLEMAFVGKPDIQVISSGPALEFFYMQPLPPGLPGQLRTAVFGAGTEVDEKRAGIGERPKPRCISPSGDGSGFFRPRASEGNPITAVPDVNPGLQLEARPRLSRPACRASHLPGAPQTRFYQSDESSTGRFEGSGLKARRYRNSSIRNRREGRRVSDDHSATLRSGGFRSEWPIS